MACKVDDYENSDLPERQKVALRLTDAYIGWPAGIDAALRAQVLEHYTPTAAMELLLDISKWSTQKLPVALGMDASVNPGGLSLFDFDEAGKVLWRGPLG